jgi:ankyrin repeat protein
MQVRVSVIRRKLTIFALVAGVIIVGTYGAFYWFRDYQLYELLSAAGSGDVALIDKLTASGAPVNGHFGGDGDTPLHRAAASGATAAVEVLLKRGADVNAVNEQRSTPLLYASFRGHKETVAALLRSGADPNIAETRYGSTPLMDAARKGHLEVVALLLAHGASISIHDLSGQSALDKARGNSYQDIAKALTARDGPEK